MKCLGVLNSPNLFRENVVKSYNGEENLHVDSKKPWASWTLLSTGGRALPQDWDEGEGWVVPISDFIRLTDTCLLSGYHDWS